MEDSKPIGIGPLQQLHARAKKALAAGRLNRVPAETAAAPAADAAQLAVDVYESHDTLFIVAPLAGVKASEVRVEITEDVIEIAGERVHPLPQLADEPLVAECYFGPFSRSIVLPEAVDSRRAKAEFKKNILVIALPKLDNLRTRVVQIAETE